MNRRTYLGVIAGVVAGIAGCASDGELATGTGSTSAAEASSRSTATTRTTTPTTTGYRQRFVAYLADRAVDVRAVEANPTASAVSLRYATEKETAQDLGAEIGTIAGGFYREVRAGWEMERLDATVLGRDGTRLATWYARSAWFFEFQDGELTGEELSLRVLKTVEPAE